MRPAQFRAPHCAAAIRQVFWRSRDRHSAIASASAASWVAPKPALVEVIVQVLTGRAPEVAARELHQLRTGLGGDDPPVVREHGSETCWRVSLQINSPSARRLHFWRCADGAVELSGLRLHDDFRP